MARLCPLFSGSKGNSYYIGSKSAGILIDAGRSAKQLVNMLIACEIGLEAVQAIFITHEHTDHVSALRVFLKRHRVPVFASRGTIREISGTLEDATLYEMERDVQIADMTINAFHTSHDCAEGLGYTVRTADHRKFTLATDLGFVSEEVEESLLGSDFVVLESNHDVDMLRYGPYPYMLKKRILSDRGHLSNDACAALLPKLAKNGTTRFLLAHLSQDNNTRAAALEASLQTLVSGGFIHGEDFIVDAAKPVNDEARSIIF